MNNDSESKWDRQLDNALKALPELQAPASLSPAVLARVRARSSSPWYCRSWQSWPAAAQASALAVLLVLAGGLGFALWQLPGNEFFGALWSRITGSFTTATALWNTLGVLKDTAFLILKHIGTGVLAAIAAMVFVSYLICIGTGTAVVRFALARR